MIFNLKRSKDILLITLIIVSICQVIKLWFNDSLNRNFFYSSSSINDIKTYQAEFLTPYRLITNLGGNKFNINYSELYNNKIKNIIDTSIREVVKNGEYIGTTNINWNEILKEKSFIYDYSFYINSNIFVDIFEQKNNLITSKVDKFNKIILIPENSEYDKLTLLFINENENLCYKYQIKKSDLNYEISNQIKNIYVDFNDSNLYYISSKIIGLPFEKNVFLPKWKGDKFKYNQIQANIDYYLNQEFLTYVGSGISMFFSDPNFIWQDKKDDFYIYSDENVVVKYYNNNVLEYRNYKRVTNKKTNILEDFSSAMSFIKRDNFIKNEFYLSDYSQENGRTTFYFDYIINNFVLDLNSNNKNSNNLKHAIEITVENGVPIKYVKIFYVFQSLPDKVNIINKTWLDIINDLNISNVNNINLIYGPINLEQDLYNDYTNLNWNIEKKSEK